MRHSSFFAKSDKEIPLEKSNIFNQREYRTYIYVQSLCAFRQCVWPKALNKWARRQLTVLTNTLRLRRFNVQMLKEQILSSKMSTILLWFESAKIVHFPMIIIE